MSTASSVISSFVEGLPVDRRLAESYLLPASLRNQARRVCGVARLAISFFETAKPDLLGFDGQAPTLAVGESGLLAEDFFQDFDFLLQIVDCVLLLSINPSGKTEENERQWIHRDES